MSDGFAGIFASDGLVVKGFTPASSAASFAPPRFFFPRRRGRRRRRPAPSSPSLSSGDALAARLQQPAQGLRAETGTHMRKAP
jgi:hypothetical protein